MKEQGLTTSYSDPTILCTQPIIIHGFGRKIDSQNSLLKVRSAAKFVSRKGRIPIPIKSKSALFISSFKSSQEVSEIFKVKYTLHRKITLVVLQLTKFRGYRLKLLNGTQRARRCTFALRVHCVRVPGLCFDQVLRLR